MKAPFVLFLSLLCCAAKASEEIPFIAMPVGIGYAVDVTTKAADFLREILFWQ